MMRRQQGGPPPPPGAPGGPSKGFRVVTHTLQIATRGDGQMVDLTPDLSRLLKSVGMKEGQVTAFVPGSTASITTIEFEPGLKEDFPATMEKIAPKGASYEHDNTWHDGNGHSHVRASVIGPSLTIPFSQGRLLLGTWQQVVLNDWDNRGRTRDLVFQFIGE